MVPKLVLVVWAAVTVALSASADSGVAMITRDYADTGRQNWAATAPRPLRTAIWYPTDTAEASEVVFGEDPVFEPVAVVPGGDLSGQRPRYPLIVLSHGTGGSALMLLWLGRHLASHGYIVAAVNHHGNTAAENAYDPRGFLLYWERARDLSLVIDRVLADPLFRDRVDVRRIGAAGFSLGGFTVIEVAGGRFNQKRFDRFCASAKRDFTCEPQAEFPEAPVRFAELAQSDAIVRSSRKRSGASYRDPRVRAVFAIAPALGGGFSAAELKDVRVPVRIVVGAGDAITPPETNALHYAKLIPGAGAVVLPGNVGHYTFLHECTARGRQILPICQDGEGVDRASVHRTVRQYALEFFDRTLRVERN
ncbi:MAG TPA: peptidase [Thermoanaerobaculia bacterium]|nr:peptidase [Thermoanaerobaculia bacterium]